MRSLRTFLRLSLIVFFALVVASVDAQDVPDVNGDYDVTDADIPDSAGIFYVRTSGNDSNSGTSPSQAFRTIRRAAIMVPAGSTIYVGAGTYTTSATFLGVESTSTWPLRIVADVNGIRTGDSGPVILGPGTRMTILRCDHVRVIGFTFQGPTDRCFVWRRSTQGHVQDCTFIGGSKGVKVRSGDVKFQGCLVQDFAANGIDVYGTAELFLDDCDVENCGSAGLRMNRHARVTIESSRFVNNAGDGVSVDDITSTDDNLATIPLSQRIQDVRDLLAATMPDATQKGSDKMADAISKLDVALLAKYWQDPWHPHNKQTKDAARDLGLDADEGFEVFKKIKEALDKLKDFNDPGKDVELGNFGTVKSNVQLAHDWLLEATEATAFLALEEAFLVNSDTDVLKDFYKEYKKAQKEFDKGHYHHAAEKFGKAWEDAAKEAGSGYASLDGVGTDNDDAPDAEAARFLTITASTFNSNANGISCVIAPTLDLRTSDLSNNAQSGLYVVGGGIVEDCTITGNEKGVFLKNVTDLSAIKRLTVTDNLESGLYAEDCDLTFNSMNIGDWSISGSPYVIAGKDSDITFSSVTISGGSTAAVSIVDGTLQASYTTFSNAGYGVSSTNSNFALYYCTLSGNTVGLHADQNTAMTVQDTQINDNTEWGVKLSGRGSFIDTTISGNGTGGLELTNTIASELSIVRTNVTDNVTYGVYCDNSTLTFNTTTFNNSTISGSETSFAGFESDLTFNGLTVSGGSQYGIANYSGTVAVDSCILSGNGTGLYSENGCSATGSTFTGNTTTGASALGSATFTNCVFEANSNGLQITNDTTGTVQLVGSQIKDNTLYGVWCDACTLTFDATMQADWSVQNNGSNFGATGSTLTFDGFTISNGITYGIVSENGTLNLNYSTLSTNGTGAYVDASSTLVASGCDFTGNTAYGASILGQASLLNCSFDYNAHGLRFVNSTNGEITCSGTTASHNTESGLRLDSCSLNLTGSGIGGLTLSDNQYGIYSTNSTLVFDSFSSNSNTYGVWLSSSDVTMTNSTFTGSTHGLWATNNNSLSVDSSTFTGNSSYGVYLDGNGSVHNCSITGNGSGLYVNTTDVTDATLTGTDISGNTTYGVYVYNGSLALSSQVADGWSINSNGYNIASYQADISLTGVSMLNATDYGVYAEYGSVNLQQSTITSNSGGVWGLYNTAFTVDQSHITGSNTGSWAVYNLDGGLVMRNTVVSGAESGVYSSGPSKPATIYNSTIADASLYGLYVYDGDLTVMNTIISGTSGTYGLFLEVGANVSHSHNLVSGFTTAFGNTTADPTELLKPPRFTDAVNGDYSLAKGSPAINAGADLTAGGVTIDMLGNARPSRKVFEIGAYEYMQDGGSVRVLGWQEKQ